MVCSSLNKIEVILPMKTIIRSLITASYSFSILLFGAAISTRGYAQEFDQVSWFQITFGENLRHVTFLPAASSREMPVLGFAADPFATPAVLNFYKIDILGAKVLEKIVVPMSTDTPKIAVAHAVLAKDGNRLLISNSSHEVILFDFRTKSVIKRFSGHRYGSRFAAFSADESMILVIVDWRNVWMWELAGDSETPSQVFELPQRAARAEFIEGDSKVRVTGEETVSIYSVATGLLETYKEISPKLDIDTMFRTENILIANDGATFFAEHSHDNGESGAIGRFDRVSGANIWSSDFGKIDAPAGWPAMPNSPTGYVQTPNGRCLIVGDHGGYRVLDPETGALKWRQRLNASGHYLRISPDGKHLLSLGGSDVTVYRISPECGG